MITVGLDFGTHQTKICVEDKDGVELSYTFIKFEDKYHQDHYTLPSVVGVGEDNLLCYGYLPRRFKGSVHKYFKQKVFLHQSWEGNENTLEAMYFSIWYIAYILFELEKMFGTQFAIQMGAPTDSAHLDFAKQRATEIVVSAYKLVEDVFSNDIDAFLKTPISELRKKTEIINYTTEIKEEYGLLVFPEAYACLMPLVSRGKLGTGMNLMVDIGGGTTDISFFAIDVDNKPEVYDFFSVGKGLNYLTGADESEDMELDGNVKSESKIGQARKYEYFKYIRDVCKDLISRLFDEFKRQTSLDARRLSNALKQRPLVYCGGGSTFKSLCQPYYDFKEIKEITHDIWNTKSVNDLDEIVDNGLCPILSTAYGLSISTENDNIENKPFEDIFDKLRNIPKEERHPQKRKFIFGEAINPDGFNYGLDYDALK